MLTLTTEAAAQEIPHSPAGTAPQFVALGSGLCASIPEGPGRASARWNQRADQIVERLRQLYAKRGTALEYRWEEKITESGVMRWAALRVVDGALPADCLLAHPTVAKLLAESIEITLGATPAVYFREGELRTCAVAEAQVVPGCIGPLDLSAGYCVALPLQ